MFKNRDQKIKKTQKIKKIVQTKKLEKFEKSNNLEKIQKTGKTKSKNSLKASLLFLKGYRGLTPSRFIVDIHS